MNANATLFPTAGAVTRREVPATALVRALGALLFGAALLATSAAHASSDLGTRDWQNGQRLLDTWADGRLVDVQLRVDGSAAPLYPAPNDDDRHYFQAFAGRNYSIVLRNNTGRRVAVLLAVDGLNAVNGAITGLRADEDMYVLGPWEQATIRGWRTSLDEVRRFVFVDEQRSYAERTGQANSDMGWIRVLAFREQLPWWQGYRGGLRDERKQMFRDDRPQANAPVPQEDAPRPRGALLRRPRTTWRRANSTTAAATREPAGASASRIT